MRITLKRIILLVATVGLLLNGAIGANNVVITNMPGSLTTSTTGAGTTAASAETTTVNNLLAPYAAGDLPTVTQDIFMSAVVPTGQTGSATAEFTPTSVRSNTITRGTALNDPVYSLNAAADGTVHADVAVTTAGITPNYATAQILSTTTAPLTVVAGVANVNSLNGRAVLDAQLHLDGAASGTASASGSASYDSLASGATWAAAGNPLDTEVAGSVSGTVEISGTSARGGYVTGLTDPALATFYAAGYGLEPSVAVQAASAHMEANSRSPTLAALTATGVGTQPSFQAQTYSSTNAVSTRGLVSSGVTDATGAVEGSSSATATTSNLLAGALEVTLLGRATQSAVSEEVGANANYILDQAIGYSRVYSEANAPANTIAVTADDLGAYGETAEYALASRTTTGTDLVYGYGNVESAQWSADLDTAYTPAAVGILNGHNDPSASVSGSNGWVVGVLPGFRASATLANRNANSETFTLAQTTARYTATALPGNVYTTGIAYRIDTSAPFYASALTDASGGWNALDSASVSSTDSVRTVSTSVSDWNAVKWIQGLDSSSTSGYTDPSVLPDPVFTNPGASAFTKPADGPGANPTTRFNNFRGTTAQATVA